MSKQVLGAGDPMPAIRCQPDATLNSTPDTVLWGYIAANLPPAPTNKSGQIVHIEALSHQGLTSNQDPVKFFTSYGVPSEDVLPDALAIYERAKRPKGASVHILTGPVYWCVPSGN